MFDVCTTGDMAHIDKIFKFLLNTRYAWNEYPVFDVSPKKKKSQGVMSGDFAGHSVSDWSFTPTHKTASFPERPYFHYIHSHRLAAEM